VKKYLAREGPRSSEETEGGKAGLQAQKKHKIKDRHTQKKTRK